MKKVKVIQPADLDGRTATLSEDNKVGSMFLLTEEELTIPANLISQFIFRRAENSNQIMFCTGFMFNNTWYGDRPDDGPYLNAFTNETLYRGERPAETVEFLYKEGWQGNTVELVRWSVEKPTLKFKQIGGVHQGDYVEYEPVSVTDTTLNGQPAKTYVYDLQNVSVRFQETEQLDFELDGVRYAKTTPRLAFNNSLGTFGWVGSSVADVIAKINAADNL